MANIPSGARIGVGGADRSSARHRRIGELHRSGLSGHHAQGIRQRRRRHGPERHLWQCPDHRPAFANRQSSAILAPAGAPASSGAHLSSGTYYAELEISDAKTTTNFTATTTAQSYWAALATPLNSAQYPQPPTAVIEPYFANMPANPPAFDAAGRAICRTTAGPGARFRRPASASPTPQRPTATPSSTWCLPAGHLVVTYDGVVLTPLATTHQQHPTATGGYNRYGVVNVDAGTKSIGVALTGYGAVSAVSVSHTGSRRCTPRPRCTPAGHQPDPARRRLAYGGDLIVHGFAADQINPEWAPLPGHPALRTGVLPAAPPSTGSWKSATRNPLPPSRRRPPLPTLRDRHRRLTGVAPQPSPAHRSHHAFTCTFGSSAAGPSPPPPPTRSLTAIPIPAT